MHNKLTNVNFIQRTRKKQLGLSAYVSSSCKQTLLNNNNVISAVSCLLPYINYAAYTCKLNSQKFCWKKLNTCFI